MIRNLKPQLNCLNVTMIYCQLTQSYMTDQSPSERAEYEWCLVFGSLAVQCHRPWSRECRIECVILETVPLSHATVHSAYVEGFASLERQRLGCYRKLTRSSEFVDDFHCSIGGPGRAANLMSRVWHSSIESQCCMSTQMIQCQLRWSVSLHTAALILPQHLERRHECQVSFSYFSISSFRVPFDSKPWLSISPPQRGASTIVPIWGLIPT